MIVRSGWLVLAATFIVWLASTWGLALVVFLLAWWAAYVLFGGLRHGVVIHGLKNPFRGFGEEPPPSVDG